MSKFVLSRVNLEKGGARYCGHTALGIFDTAEQAQAKALELFGEYCFSGEVDEPKFNWKTDESSGQLWAVDFEDCSDFTMYAVDAVE